MLSLLSQCNSGLPKVVRPPFDVAIVAKFTVKDLNKDFINRGRGGHRKSCEIQMFCAHNMAYIKDGCPLNRTNNETGESSIAAIYVHHNKNILKVQNCPADITIIHSTFFFVHGHNFF